MGRDLASLLQRIRTLIDACGADPAKPLLTEMEHTLTDGYAGALELELERLRLERNLDGPDAARELRQLAEQLRAADDELAALRHVLGDLQRRVDADRAAA
jgi:hypothetical protein